MAKAKVVTKRHLSGTAKVDGTDYLWLVQHEPKWTSLKGRLGLTLSIRLEEDLRELLLEFPFVWTTKRSMPNAQRPAASAEDIAEGIRAAIEAGWRPGSRGRPFHFFHGETPVED